MTITMITPREREVLDALVAEDCGDNRQLAARLHMTPRSLRQRLYEIADKLLEEERHQSIRTALAVRWNCELFRIGVAAIGEQIKRRSRGH